jgi:RNA polymerase sigma factor (TIGR02999 family)
MAEGFMRKERSDHTWSPTALAHEAVLKLYEDGAVFRRGRARGYFFGAVVGAMRQLLREHARAKRAAKAGGGWSRVPLDDVLDLYGQKVDVLDLEEALEKLAAVSPRQHEVVTLRFYGGWQMGEIAELLGVSDATADNDFRAARAFLRARLPASRSRSDP